MRKLSSFITGFSISRPTIDQVPELMNAIFPLSEGTATAAEAVSCVAGRITGDDTPVSCDMRASRSPRALPGCTICGNKLGGCRTHDTPPVPDAIVDVVQLRYRAQSELCCFFSCKEEVKQVRHEKNGVSYVQRGVSAASHRNQLIESIEHKELNAVALVEGPLPNSRAMISGVCAVRESR